MLWQFRLLALASGLLLWSSLGVAFGLLQRADHPSHSKPGERAPKTQAQATPGTPPQDRP